MQSGSSSGSARAAERELPVFIFPTALSFYASEKDSLRQILTIYNPYEFPLRFRVYCTAPKLYSVVDAQGTVKPGFCSDVIIRHNAPIAAHFNKPDKFRVQVYDAYAASSGAAQSDALGSLLGRKTFEAVLREKRVAARDGHGEGDEDSDSEFAQLPAQASGSASQQRPPGAPTPGTAQWQPSLARRSVHFAGPTVATPGHFAAPSPLIILIALLCVSALCLPTDSNQGAGNSPWPQYLHLTLNQKLVAAYVLGLVTMVILRS